MKKQLWLFFFFCIFSFTALAQNGIIRGSVVNKVSNEALPFANVVVQQDLQKFATTDLEGKFEIKGLKPGLYNLEISFVGYKPQVIYEVEVTNSRPAIVQIQMEEDAVKLEDVEITATGFYKPTESPVSYRTVGVNEIKRNPGGNRDISRVLRSLPGVASTVAFRNDVIIRGGSPNENRFFLDGIEVPNINHFATQGASGGPVGLINVDFIREVEFYSGAFPATRGNALSSVIEFNQKDGRDDKLTFNGILGASDLGVTLEGPLGKKTTFVASARRSYLQFLFAALGLPFLPTYNDAQFKVKHKFNEKHQISFIGLGAIDNFELNLDADETPEQRYILNNLPVNEQWNYTVGTKYEKFRDDGKYTFILSRNHLNNTAIKYENNVEEPENLIQDYASQEIENKFRFEDYRNKGRTTFTYGANLESARYTNSTFFRIATPEGAITQDFDSELTFMKYGLFAQASQELASGRLILSLGLRTDFNDYSSKMNNPLEQLSPRFSVSYAFTSAFSINANVGRYYQLPAYTVLGYRNNDNELENKDRTTYIRADHLVAGFELTPNSTTRFTIEGFYKKYNNYPFLLRDSISLANLGSDFGVIGNDPTSSISEGRSYGVEFLAQQKLSKGFYGLVAYTFVRSEFQDKNGEYVPAAWDNRHIVSLTGGKKFKRNWELGLRWLFSGGAPFTPWDVEATVLRDNWDVRGRGIPDYNRLNTERGSVFHQLDVRLDKKYFFNKWSLNVFLDIQNIYAFATQLQENIDVLRDDSGNPLVDPNDPSRYQYQFLMNETGTPLPTLGIIVEL